MKDVAIVATSYSMQKATRSWRNPPDPAANEQKLLRSARVPQGVDVDYELPARVRRKFHDACMELKIDSETILKQFDRWRYTEKDLLEMDRWDKSTTKQHSHLLAREAEMGLDPHKLSPLNHRKK